MINIQRSDCPAVLLREGNTVRYNRKTVVKELWKMQHGKCCYCENHIPEKGHSKAVEHFKPKATFTSLVNDWDNLLLACSQCNGKKSDDFAILLTDNIDEPKVVFIDKPSTEESAILDPCDVEVNPESHISFQMDKAKIKEWGIICSNRNSLKGKTTIEVIGLSSWYYTKKHRATLNILETEYLTLLEAYDIKNEPKVEALKDRFENKMCSKHDQSALARAYVNKMEININFQITIPIGFD